MTPDELRLEEAWAWLERAHRDLQAAKLLLAGNAHAEALFHCQQAVEKVLKAFLTFHRQAFRKTHDMGELTPGCLAIDGSLGSVAVLAETLTPYAWRFRYPGVPYEPDAAEATAGVKKAETVVQEIQRRLPGLA